ncbi:hypothetical protein L1987_74227 [Smallanthus sonchifolius]|uniref:Uncharacterized protein n=1 Tax=Smallanthus sonchifolius TaxID=185202 RepID=A0ACB9A2G4_9ASTR|nr:hypothetical protein L1987_74227 [Smallanthus sonchifolius]
MCADEVVDNEEVVDKKNAEELVEKTLVEDEVIDNEEVSTNENEEIIREEIGVEKIIDDGVNCGNDEQDMQTIGAKIDEKNQEGENEEKHEVNDEEEEIILFMRTWLMEHGGYKQEDTQEWGLDKLKEEMNKVEIEIAMSIEVRQKWRHKLFDANVGYTWPSLNRMGDERLLKELDNLKKLVGAKSVLKEIQEETDPENVDKYPNDHYVPTISDSQRLKVFSDNLEITEIGYKYVSKILLSDLNIYKNHLLDLAKEYKKSTEGKKEDTKRNLLEELMERQASTF